jgi:hypothetical protein
VLATGRRRPAAVFDSVKTVKVSEEALRSVDPHLRTLVNVNTFSDLLDARSRAADGTGKVRGGVTHRGHGDLKPPVDPTDAE